MSRRSSIAFTRFGQILAVSAALAIVALWIELMRQPKSAGPAFLWIALGSIVAALASLLAAVLRSPLAVAVSFAFLLPWGLYFVRTESGFRWIGYATFALGAAAVLLLAGRIGEAISPVGR